MDKRSFCPLFCDNHILVAVKPSGILTQPDSTSTISLEELAKAWVKEKYNKSGGVFLHPVHRLDKSVSGLVVLARTSKALERLNKSVRNQRIKRIYKAEVEGHLSGSGKLEHYLIHGDHEAIIGNKNSKDAKFARLFYQVTHKLPHSTIVEIELETGRYHQIRAQFGAIGHPIKGDRRYGSKSGDGSAIELACVQLSFEHPVLGSLQSFSL